MPEVRKDFYFPTTERAEISEIKDGIYRISGFVKDYGISFNQFLINDDKPTLIHTGPVGMYPKIEEKVKEVIPLKKWHLSRFSTLKAKNGEGWNF